jgi:hypothetical protein
MKRFALNAAVFFLLLPLMQNQGFAEKIYWTAGNKIQRANLDGTHIEDLVAEPGAISEIALDLTAERVYWTNAVNGTIQRANVDGTERELLLEGLTVPAGIALDCFNHRMYWTTGGSDDRIQRANLDGTGV